MRQAMSEPMSSALEFKRLVFCTAFLQKFKAIPLAYFLVLQRGDAEMSQKLWRVVRACVDMGENNPIEQIHDQGAGGNCNVVCFILPPSMLRRHSALLTLLGRRCILSLQPPFVICTDNLQLNAVCWILLVLQLHIGEKYYDTLSATIRMPRLSLLIVL